MTGRFGTVDSDSRSEKQFVVFELGPETYGVDISQVREIMRMQEITRIPNSPDFVKGVVNIRGHIIPIIDLRDRFGVPAGGQVFSNRIIVTEIGQNTVGLIVDAVSEVVTIDLASIEPPSPVLVSSDTRFLHGIAKLGDRLILILDASRILSFAHEQSLADLSGSLAKSVGVAEHGAVVSAAGDAAAMAS